MKDLTAALRILFLVLTLSGSSARGAADTPAHAATSPGEADARAAITRLVHGQYAAIERGNLDEWGAAFLPQVLLLGSDPTEVLLGRDTVLGRMHKAAAARMDAAVKRTYRSKRLRIGLSPDRRAAWVADEIEYILDSGRAPKTVIFRVSQVVLASPQDWQIAIAHYSIPVDDSVAFARTWPLPVEIPEDTAPAALPIVKIYQAAPTDHFPGTFSARQDVLLIGTTGTEWIEGGAAAKRFTGQGQPGGIDVRRRGGLHAQIAPAGTLGWAAWNATLTVKSERPLPVRVLAVFLREPSGWHKVQEHVSIAVPD